jgi:hypothetical protein
LGTGHNSGLFFLFVKPQGSIWRIQPLFALKTAHPVLISGRIIEEGFHHELFSLRANMQSYFSSLQAIARSRRFYDFTSYGAN